MNKTSSRAWRDSWASRQSLSVRESRARVISTCLIDALEEMGPPVPAQIVAEYRAVNPGFADSLVALNREWQKGIDAGDPWATLTALYDAANTPLTLVAHAQLAHPALPMPEPS